MKTDFDAIDDGASVVLIPNSDNPLHSTPVKATYSSGYFYCDGSKLEDGPDYYLGDVAKYNDGFYLA